METSRDGLTLHAAVQTFRSSIAVHRGMKTYNFNVSTG